MTVDTNTMISITEANQNFSKVARVVDEHGTAVILKNNVPKYLVIDFGKAEQEKIRGQYYHKQDRLLPYTEAQTLAPVFDRESYRLPASFGERNLLGKNMDLQDLIAKIDWTPFFHFWGFKGKFPEIIHQHEEAGDVCIHR